VRDTPEVTAAKNGRLAAATLRALLKHANNPPSRHRKLYNGKAITPTKLADLMRHHEKNLDKVEQSMVTYARTAARFANIFLDNAEEVRIVRVPRRYRTISVSCQEKNYSADTA
jgi:hypothetical protein